MATFADKHAATMADARASRQPRRPAPPMLALANLRRKVDSVTLDEISIIALYSAMAVYAIAFIAFAIDLAKRSAVAPCGRRSREAAALAPRRQPAQRAPRHPAADRPPC